MPVAVNSIEQASNARDGSSRRKHAVTGTSSGSLSLQAAVLEASVKHPEIKTGQQIYLLARGTRRAGPS
jgi:hypothetical protein